MSDKVVKIDKEVWKELLMLKIKTERRSLNDVLRDMLKLRPLPTANINATSKEILEATFFKEQEDALKKEDDSPRGF